MPLIIIKSPFDPHKKWPTHHSPHHVVLTMDGAKLIKIRLLAKLISSALVRHHVPNWNTGLVCIG